MATLHRSEFRTLSSSVSRVHFHPSKMFKLAILVALVGVSMAAPAPGGLTGLILDHGLGSIHAPNVISHAPPAHVSVIAQPVAHAPAIHAAPLISHAAPLISHSAPLISHAAPLIAHAEPLHVPHHQPLAPRVHIQPIVTKTVLPGHSHYAPLPVHGHGLLSLH